MQCECCGAEMNKSDMVEELAELRDWTEGKEYNINTDHYGNSTINIKKPGIEDLLQYFRYE